MKKYILLILIFLLITCTDRSAIDLYYRSLKVYTNHRNIDNIERAFKLWDGLKRDKHIYINKPNDADLRIYRLDEPKWGNIKGMVSLPGTMDCVDEFRVIAHELGHFYGYGHSENSASIMYRYDIESATNLIDLRKNYGT